MPVADSNSKQLMKNKNFDFLFATILLYQIRLIKSNNLHFKTLLFFNIFFILIFHFDFSFFLLFFEFNFSYFYKPIFLYPFFIFSMSSFLSSLCILNFSLIFYFTLILFRFNVFDIQHFFENFVNSVANVSTRAYFNSVWTLRRF